ncbi:carbohydrate ABC transporter permease [Clostridium folliculivorans]|uniref:ABC transporter permease n=1 Tax=Clostridium folliculivorans TaxID=2886038 RepID=A0A9W6DD54_9CLOT|nr:sugar ABC transporter permease [Clostridium folliculivorans]GKU27333.1 ABC transporter permease [Clostridium folliculivorans]GKU32184.1 ABC transporter permease [Clostridium folliculivorans]
MFKVSKMSYNAQKKLIIVLFSIVPVALLLIFCYYPLVRMVEYSFTDWNGISKDFNIVFFDNYKTIFSKSEYFKVFKTSIYYFLATFIQMAIALYFATILSFKVKFKNFFKGAIFFPYLLNGVAIGFIFLYFFQPNGTLDTIMKAVGLGNYTQLWLGNPNIINISLAFTSIWRYMGGNFIIFLGTIQSIDGEIYEAAEIDGANRWRQFISIILPNIKRIVVLNIVLGINGALSVFEIPYIMTQGANGSKTFVIQTLDTGFKYQKLGLACSMAIVLLLISISVTLIQKKFLSEED